MADLNTVKILHESGIIRFHYSRYASADGSRWIRHGLFFAYHENGSLASEGSYEHGKEHGMWRDYHLNGQLAAEGEYMHGKKTGFWRFWSASGIPEQPDEA